MIRLNKTPLLSSEVDIDKISYINNKQYININYENEALYLQTPIFKFIQPIVKQKVNDKIYNELYLFLTPEDKTTYKFIDLVNKLEQKTVSYIDNKFKISSIIKIMEANNQMFKYVKVKLLDQTKIEYNNRCLTLDELNNLTCSVNLKLIFEINMIWMSDKKFGIYLKPLKIKVIDIIPEIIIDFRNDSSDSETDYENTQTEVDDKSISLIVNNMENFVSIKESDSDSSSSSEIRLTKYARKKKNKKSSESTNSTESLELEF